MKRQYKYRIALISCAMVLIYGTIAGFGLHFSSSYIKKQLLQSSQNDAIDIAGIIGKNFSITDAEVDYMKALTFNEMETDPINQRLMNTVSGLALNDKISNIYVMALLPDSEVKYTVDERYVESLGAEAGTRLNGIWLLNGKFDKSGFFQKAVREDIYRYMELCENDKKILDSRKSFGLVSEDVWGEFITGYVPLYSVEGSYVGVLGVDMDINVYNDNVSQVTTTLFFVYLAVILMLLILFLLFFAKYQEVKRGALYYEFYSRLSHDLRTPMNGILGFADLSKSEDDPQALHEDISKIEKSGRYLLALINDTLDFQKMHGNKLTLHKEIIDVREHLNEIVQMIEETAKKKGVRFETNLLCAEVEGYVLADGIRLKQIFVNLLSNAVKFTPSGGSVRWNIQFLSREQNVDHCLLTVQDTGIGMSKKFLTHEIFKPFSQEYNATTTQYAGSGLGLSIVKSLVEQMGGHIEVESEKGEGTTFRVYLDFERVDAEQAQKMRHSHAVKEEHGHAALEGRKILLTEDHPLNAEIARKLLQKVGCEVIWAKNGQEALSCFAESPVDTFDIILMDIRMPIMDGLEAAKRIRKLEREDAKRIPIIAMTANAYEEDAEKSEDAGMNAHLAKPIEPKLLYDTMESFLHGENDRQ